MLAERDGVKTVTIALMSGGEGLMLQRIVDADPPLDEEQLRAFEARHKVCLPIRYRAFLLRNNGGRPIPSVFTIDGFPDNPDGAIHVFFGLNTTIESEDLDKLLTLHKGKIPNGILPIACTGGGDMLCLDLRTGGDQIVYWDCRPFWGANVWNEDDLYFIAETFDSLLLELHEG
jgi:hypothetical protein